MPTVTVTTTYSVEPCESADYCFDLIPDHLRQVEQDYAHLSDSGMSATLSNGTISLSMYADADDFNEAIKLGQQALNEALNRAGIQVDADAKPGMPKLVTQAQEAVAADFMQSA